LVSNINTGGSSRDVAAPKDGATAYVTNSGSNSVSVIDLTTLTTKYTISVGETPLKIDISPDGTRAYVTNFTSHTVSVIDLTKKPEVVCKTINVGINPYGVAVSSDGKYVYVANYTSENISVIDADPNSGGFDHAVANINTGTRNRDAAVNPDGAMLAVAGDNGLKLIRINRTATGFDYVISNSSSGTKTRDIAMNTNGALAFVTTLENELIVVDVNPKSAYFGAVVANTNTGSRPGDVKGDFNGMFIYITNPDNNQVSVYQINGSSPGNAGTTSQPLSLTLYKTINVGTDPEGLFISPKVDAYQLLVVNSGGLTAKSGSVSVFRICCAENTASEDIGNVIFVIQDMASRKIITKQSGDMLINKMNDALQNIARGKTKTAINSLNTFNNKVKSLMNSRKIPTYEGNELIDAANRIIAKLQVTKSLTIDSIPGYNNKPEPDLISISRLGNVFPNPFSETVTINYEIANDNESYGKTLVRIYDINGRTVTTIEDKTIQPGRYASTWNGNYDNGGRAPDGIYYLLFRMGNIEEVKEILLIR
jgi:YVTN family beta-propeller protein